MWANICHGKANSRGWQIQSSTVTTVPCLLIKMLLGHRSPGGSFICRSWLLLGLLLPSWSIYEKKIRLQWIFPSEQPTPNKHRYCCVQLHSPGLSLLVNHPAMHSEGPSFFSWGPCLRISEMVQVVKKDFPGWKYSPFTLACHSGMTDVPLPFANTHGVYLTQHIHINWTCLIPQFSLHLWYRVTVIRTDLRRVEMS